jgi:hypothetical protein
MHNFILKFQKHLNKCCLESARCPTVFRNGLHNSLFHQKSNSIRETIVKEIFPFQSNFLSHHLLTRSPFLLPKSYNFSSLWFQEGETGSEEIPIQKSWRITGHHIHINQITSSHQ